MDSEPPFLPLWQVPAMLDRQATALVHAGERWTWAQLDHRSRQWAAVLQRAGVVADTPVAFALPNGSEFFAVTFAIYRLGAIPAPMSTKLTREETSAILEVLRPSATLGEALDFNATVAAPSREAEALEAPGITGSSWKACMSGGSTGRPKVIIDGRPAGFSAGTEFIGIPAGSRVLVPGPLYHNAPFSAAIFALWRGSAVITLPRFDAEEAIATIARERVEWALMVPTMLHRILRLDRDTLQRHDLGSWKMVVHTAAPIASVTKRDWIERFGADHIWEVYGSTEGLVRTWIGGREWLERPGSVGRAIGGARLRILDERARDLPPGVEGEIFAMPPGGPASSYHYLGAERRRTDDGWESVGDFGRLDADGYLYIADRRADLIISGGVNIWPAEIEAALLEHPDILSCAVMGMPDEDLGERVHALVQSQSGALTLETVRDFLAARLSAQKLPRSLALSAAAVRDDAGKVRKTRKPSPILETNDEH